MLSVLQVNLSTIVSRFLGEPRPVKKTKKPIKRRTEEDDESETSSQPNRGILPVTCLVGVTNHLIHNVCFFFCKLATF